MADDTVEFELILLNNDPSNSRIILKQSKTTKFLITHLFESGLRTILFGAFRRMINLNIRRITGAGSIKKQGSNPRSLREIITINDEVTRIEAQDGYRTFSSYPEGHTEEIDLALMLLIWKRSPHFVSDNMDGTNDFSSSMRACVVCGKIHHGVRTGQHIGGIKLGLDPSPVREVIAHPYEHCFNQNCFSHEIERMIDLSYVFVPPKPGKDLEADMRRVLTKGSKDINPR